MTADDDKEKNKMRNLRLTYAIVGIGIGLVSWFPYPVSEPIGSSAAYEVVTT